MTLSPKQRVILSFLRYNDTLSLDQAVLLIGRDLYANAPRHVGAVLSRMVARRLIERVKPGLFRACPPTSAPLP